MKAKNLRIGNLVSHPRAEYDIITRIDCTDKQRGESVCFENTNNGYWLYDDKCNEIVKPIPLTEKWLLKFGFEKDDYLYYKDSFTYNIISKELYYKSKYPIKAKDIKYVHELQNLFFAITGTELELNTEVSV